MSDARKLLLWASIVAAAMGVVAAFSSCGKQQSAETAHPAPSSSLTLQEARQFAIWWTMGHPEHAVFGCAPTGSMVPVLDSRSILLVENFRGGLPLIDDICIYDHDPKLPAVCHRVTAVDAKAQAVIFAGDANRGGDGWIPIARINWRVAGVLYTAR